MCVSLRACDSTGRHTPGGEGRKRTRISRTQKKMVFTQAQVANNTCVQVGVRGIDGILWTACWLAASVLSLWTRPRREEEKPKSGTEKKMVFIQPQVTVHTKAWLTVEDEEPPGGEMFHFFMAAC